MVNDTKEILDAVNAAGFADKDALQLALSLANLQLQIGALGIKRQMALAAADAARLEASLVVKDIDTQVSALQGQLAALVK